MTETVADFKARIALLMRERETGKKYSIMGASRAHDCVVRKTNNRKKNENESNRKNSL
jgi:hypothetical protein